MKKLLVVGGLTLILLGAVSGGIYGGFFLPDTKHAMSDLLTEAFNIAAESPNTAKKTGDKYVSKVLFDSRMASVHSHTVLFGVTALALGLLAPYFKLPRWLALTAAWMLLISGLFLPFGVFIETWFVRSGGYTSLIGGVLFLASIFIFMIGTIRSKKLKNDYK